LFSAFDLDFFESKIGPVLPLLDLPMASGRLGQVVEGGGKRRIFAIGNYINQRLLKPVHDWLMEVLARIPMDGTFHQTTPLDRLVGSSTSYSFDLKSATNRWPLYFLFEVFQAFFDRSFVLIAVCSSFTTYCFFVTFD